MTALAEIEERLGMPGVTSDEDLARIVETRLPTKVVKALIESGVYDTEVYALVIPRRTLAHRMARREPLSQDESDRAVRVARITALAAHVFNEPGRAWKWLRKPAKRFDHRTPMDMLRTEAGARLIEEMLYQLDEGFFA